ncbi:hypothetical protein Tco_0953561 [Tanacetum coccineum]|uniref:Retrotransposon gag domain-containing protein n=1 Tax=Tanacetum coccineum TaxID=301880 RepID=A0ABQ5E0B1_9ASTR
MGDPVLWLDMLLLAAQEDAMMMLLTAKIHNLRSPVDLHGTLLVCAEGNLKRAIRAKRERVRIEATRAGGPAGGPAAAPNTFEINECAEGRKVKFATATLIGRDLLRWNYQRLEDELRHLKLMDMNIAAYTERFNELALLCPDVVPNEKKKVDIDTSRVA